VESNRVEELNGLKSQGKFDLVFLEGARGDCGVANLNPTTIVDKKGHSFGDCIRYRYYTVIPGLVVKEALFEHVLSQLYPLQSF